MELSPRAFFELSSFAHAGLFEGLEYVWQAIPRLSEYLARVLEPGLERANVVGCLCTPLDLLASNVELTTAEIGDLVVIFQSGAYGLTASPLNFLGHDNPREALV